MLLDLLILVLLAAVAVRNEVRDASVKVEVDKREVPVKVEVEKMEVPPEVKEVEISAYKPTMRSIMRC